jgi:hypothetical protein
VTKRESISYSRFCRIQLTMIIVGAGIILGGCSDEKANVKYSGISADNAITLLKKSDSQEKNQNILRRVSEDAQYGFDWSEFWTRADEQGIIGTLNTENQKTFFALAAKSCSPKEFNAFAKITLAHPEFHESVLGNTPTCTENLSHENFKAYFEYLKPKVFSQKSAYYTYFVNLISRQYKGTSDHANLLHSLDEVTSRQWKDLLQDFFKIQASSLAIEVANIYGDLYGSNALIDVIVLPVTENSESFKKFQQVFGTSRALDLLSRLPKSFYVSEERTEKQWLGIIGLVTSAFISQTFPERESFSGADQAYLDYELIVKLAMNLEKKISTVDLLSHLDKTTRALENKISSSSSNNFFENHDKNIWTLFLRYRIEKQISLSEVEQALALETNASLIYQLQRTRLNIYSLNDEYKLHNAITLFCEQLELAGVNRRSTDVDKFQANMLEAPGCLHLSNIDPETALTINQERVEQSLFGVFVTEGASLRIRTQSLDASMIDLTSTLKHPDLTFEPPLDDDHALAFPMVLGFRLEKPSDSFSQGTYYIISHLTWRKATNGRSAVTQPLAGYSGGALDMEVTDHENSFEPKITSIGGPGQKGAPVRLGGKPSTSQIDKSAVQMALSSNPDFNEHSAQTRILLSRPRLSILEEILKTAQVNPETQNIEVFVDSKIWWNSLSPIDQEKVNSICGGQGESQTCAHQLAVKAAEQIHAEMTAAREGRTGSYVLPRLALEEYTEPAGSLGPVNPDGPEGAPGELSVKGFTHEH